MKNIIIMMIIVTVLFTTLGCTSAYYNKKLGFFYLSIGQERHLKGDFKSQKGEQFGFEYSSRVDPEVQAYKEGIKDGLKQLIK